MIFLNLSIKREKIRAKSCLSPPMQQNHFFFKNARQKTFVY